MATVDHCSGFYCVGMNVTAGGLCGCRCDRCAETEGGWVRDLGLSIARFVRRAEVEGLVDAVRDACEVKADVADKSRDYDYGASLAEWDVLITRSEAAGERMNAALTRLAELAMEWR